MIDPALYVGQCIEPDCNNPVYRRTKSGAAPKRCDTCRPNAFKGGLDRGRHGRAEGPIRQARELMRNVTPDVRMAVASTVLSLAVGVGDTMAESIISAIDRLLEHGESDVEIRIRLNPNPARFGTAPAGAYDEEDE